MKVIKELVKRRSGSDTLEMKIALEAEMKAVIQQNTRQLKIFKKTKRRARID